mgnify:CR=1 FL=1
MAGFDFDLFVIGGGSGGVRAARLAAEAGREEYALEYGEASTEIHRDAVLPGQRLLVVDDVLAWYREPVEEYVRRRHAHFQLHGVRNPEAFRLIAGELRERLVAPPELSERQLRRMIYG